jgi:hypothetical protein
VLLLLASRFDTFGLRRFLMRLRTLMDTAEPVYTPPPMNSSVSMLDRWVQQLTDSWMSVAKRIVECKPCSLIPRDPFEQKHVDSFAVCSYGVGLEWLLLDFS